MLKKVFRVLANNWTVVGIHLFINVLIARKFGPSGKGIIAIVLAGIGILSLIGNMGLPNSSIYYKKKGIYNERTLSFIFSFTTIAFIIILIVLFYINQKFIVGLFFDEYTEINSMILAIFLLLVITLIKNYFVAIYLGDENVRYHSFLTVGSSILLIAFITISILFSNSIHYIIYAYFLSDLCTIMFLLLYRRNRDTSQIMINFQVLKEVMVYGIKSQIIPLGNALYVRFDLIIITYYLTSHAAGIYSVSTYFYQSILSLPVAFNTLFFGRASTIDKTKAVNLIVQTYKTILIALIPLIILFMFTQTYIIALLFGSKFQEAVVPSNILIFASFLMSISSISQPFFMSIGKPEVSGKIMIVGGFTKLLIGLLLTPLFGLNGLAISTLITSIMIFLSRFYIFKKESNLDYTEFLLSYEDVQSFISKLKHLSSK